MAHELQQFAETPPSVTILSDHAARGTLDDLRSPDRLDLRSRLAGIYDILRHRNTECPVAIALYGDWGSGKTSAMRWLQTRLTEWNALQPDKRRSPGEGDNILPHPRVHPIWFDPWKYHSREDVWRGIIAEVILGLLRVRTDWSQDRIANVKFAAKRFGTFLGRSFLTALSHLKFSIGAKSETGVKAEAGVEVSGAMFEDIVQDGTDYRHPEKGFLNEFEDTLRTFIHSCIPNKETAHGHYFEDRIVLFIDDLDRCLPDVALEVLEALKLYLNMPAIAFVVGLDESIVQSVVQEHYKKAGVDQIKARDYLAKLFQVELRIAPTDKQMEGYLDKQLEALNQVTNGYWNNNLEGTAGPIITRALTALTGGNPREIKRQLNSSLLYARSIAENQKLIARSGEPDDIANKLPPADLKARKKDNFASGLAYYFIHRLIHRAYTALQGRFTTVKSEHDWLKEASEIRRDEGWRHEELLRVIEVKKLHAESSRFGPETVAALFSPGGSAGSVPADTKQTGDSDIRRPLVTIADFAFHCADDTWQRRWQELYLRRPKDTNGPIESAFFIDELLWLLLSVPFSADLAQFSPPQTAAAPPAPALNIRTLPPGLQEKLLAATGRSLDDFDLAALATVEALEIPEMDIHDAHLSFLSHCTALKDLNLRSNPITAAGLAALPGLGKLEKLALSRTLLRAIPALPEGLMDFHLSHCPGLTSMAGLPAGVKDVYLRYCPGLTRIADLPDSVQRLFLRGGTGLTDIIGTPKNLEGLFMHGCTALTKLNGLPDSLRELDLGGCTSLTSLEGVPSAVASLDLRRCTGLTRIAGLPNGVKTLDLTGCTELLELGSLPPGLQEVNLEHTPKLPEAVKMGIRALVEKNGGEVKE